MKAAGERTRSRSQRGGGGPREILVIDDDDDGALSFTPILLPLLPHHSSLTRHTKNICWACLALTVVAPYLLSTDSQETLIIDSIGPGGSSGSASRKGAANDRDVHAPTMLALGGGGGGGAAERPSSSHAATRPSSSASPLKTSASQERPKVPLPLLHIPLPHPLAVADILSSLIPMRPTVADILIPPLPPVTSMISSPSSPPLPPPRRKHPPPPPPLPPLHSNNPCSI